MRIRVLWVLFALLTANGVCLAEFVGHALPKHQLQIPLGFTWDQGWAKAGDRYRCIAETWSGVIVTAPGATHSAAHLPLRDEWGHETAESISGGPVASGCVLRVKTPVRLQPCTVTLLTTHRYAVVDTPPGQYVLLVPATWGLSFVTVPVDRDDAVFEPLSVPGKASVATNAPERTVSPTIRVAPRAHTRAEWLAVFRELLGSSPPSDRIAGLLATDFKLIFGEPTRTATDKGSSSWFYACSDGEVEVALSEYALEDRGIIEGGVHDGFLMEAEKRVVFCVLMAYDARP